MTLRTTMGQLLVNNALPPELRDYSRVLDKKSIKNLLQDVAEKHPDKYRSIVHDLSRIGYRQAYFSGGNSFGLRHMRRAVAARASALKLRKKIEDIYMTTGLKEEQKEQKVVDLLMEEGPKLTDQIYDESMSTMNPLAMQVISGSRGNKMNLRELRGAPLLYVDHHERPIPIPVLNSYSQGLTPVQYYSSTFGARKGLADTKFATQEAGFLSKQLNQVAHRLVVTGLDADGDGEPDNTPRGLPASIDDPDNEGALLAYPVGKYPRNTVLTPKILSDLRSKGVDEILLRSPAVFGAPDGGLYARDLGVRERGDLPPVGDFVGIAAAQALSEPLAQAQLSSKHSGGLAGGTAGGVRGFKLINQLSQVPKAFKGGAAHSHHDGRVERIRKAPQGGQYVTVNNQDHYVGAGFDLLVKQGDKVEAGDVISEGIPNPAEIVKYKGVGEGRRYFIDSFVKAYQDSGISAHRRNVEILARGLINHVRMTDEVDDYVPDDVVPYNRLEHFYKPREGYTVLDPKRAQGMYLEKPVLHYSIGTRIQPSMLKRFQKYGIKNLMVHNEPPPFQPEMIRAMENLAHDPDWMTRFLGSYLQKNLLKGVHRGATSDTTGTSYVPALAEAKEFGQKGKTRGPEVQTISVPQRAELPLPPTHPERAKSKSVLDGII